MPTFRALKPAKIFIIFFRLCYLPSNCNVVAASLVFIYFLCANLLLFFRTTTVLFLFLLLFLFFAWLLPNYSTLICHMWHVAPTGPNRNHQNNTYMLLTLYSAKVVCLYKHAMQVPFYIYFFFLFLFVVTSSTFSATVFFLHISARPLSCHNQA